MKIKLLVAEFERRVRQLSSVVSSKPTIPALACLKIEAADGRITLTGSDLGSSLTVSSPAEVLVPGTALVPAKRLQDILASLPAPDVSLELGANGVTLRSGKYKAILTTSPVADFPEAQVIPERIDNSFGLPGLRDLIDKTKFAVPTTSGKYTVATALLVSNGKVLRLVATDGIRMALAEYAREGAEFRALVPRTALDLLGTLSGEAVTILESDNSFFFLTESEILIVGKTVAEFPNYEQILPTSARMKLQTSTAALKGAIARTLPLADEEEAQIIFSVEKAPCTSLVLKANSPAAGMASDDVEIVSEGAAVEFNLNANFLMQFLEKASGDQPLIISAKDSKQVIAFQAGPGYRYLQMPIGPKAAAPEPEKKAAKEPAAAK